MIIRLSHSWFPIYAPPNQQKKQKKTWKSSIICSVHIIPRCSMYGIFTYMSNQNGPNVGEYSIDGASGIYSIHIFRPSSIISHYFPESIFHSYFLLHGGFHEKKSTILVGSPFMEPPIFGPSIDYIHPLKLRHSKLARSPKSRIMFFIVCVKLFFLRFQYVCFFMNSIYWYISFMFFNVFSMISGFNKCFWCILQHLEAGTLPKTFENHKQII